MCDDASDLSDESKETVPNLWVNDVVEIEHGPTMQETVPNVGFKSEKVQVGTGQSVI